MKISEKFNVKVVDFSDVELIKDNNLFIDPFLIAVGDTDFCKRATNDIIDFFDMLLNCAINGNEKNASIIINGLCERNETRLGYSKERLVGKGFSKNAGMTLYKNLKESNAIKTGLVKDIFDCSIMVEKIGQDKISDLITNIIFKQLIDFTQAQCKKLAIPLQEVELKKRYWNSLNRRWEKEKTFLPVDNGMPILFVPNNVLADNSFYTYQTVYRELMLPYYESLELSDASSSLVYLLKNGKRKVDKKKLRKKYPCSKKSVEDFVRNYSDKYTSYKDSKFKYYNYSKRRMV